MSCFWFPLLTTVPCRLNDGKWGKRASGPELKTKNFPIWLLEEDSILIKLSIYESEFTAYTVLNKPKANVQITKHQRRWLKIPFMILGFWCFASLLLLYGYWRNLTNQNSHKSQHKRSKNYSTNVSLSSIKESDFISRDRLFFVKNTLEFLLFKKNLTPHPYSKNCFVRGPRELGTLEKTNASRQMCCQ